MSLQRVARISPAQFNICQKVQVPPVATPMARKHTYTHRSTSTNEPIIFAAIQSGNLNLLVASSTIVPDWGFFPRLKVAFKVSKVIWQ